MKKQLNITLSEINNLSWKSREYYFLQTHVSEHQWGGCPNPEGPFRPLWKDQPWGWVFVHLVSCWKWDIKHSSPWESVVPRRYPSVTLKWWLSCWLWHLPFRFNPYEQRDETTEGHYCHLACPAIFLLQYVAEMGWSATTSSREAPRAGEPSPAPRSCEIWVVFYAVHKTWAYAPHVRTLHCQYF